MTQYYINSTGAAQTDSYGTWAIGSDVAAGTSPATAWATTGKAGSTMSSGGGDTCVIYGNAANPVRVKGPASASAVMARGGTLLASEDYGVILEPDAAATDAVVTVNSTRTLTLGQTTDKRFIFDAKNQTKWCLGSGAADCTYVVHSPRFLNFNQAAVSATANLTVTGEYECNTTTSYTGTGEPCGGLIGAVSAVNKVFNVGKGKITINHTGASGTIYGLKANTTGANAAAADAVTGYAVTIGETEINITTANAATIIKPIMTGDVSSATIGVPSSITAADITINTNGPSTNVSGAEFCGSRSTNVPSTMSIKRIKATHTGSAPTGGHGVMIGNDNNGFAIGTLPITVTAYEDCESNNHWHGVMAGGVLSVEILRPKSRETNLGTHFKNCDNCHSYAGFHIDPRETAARFKSSTDCSHDNPTIVYTKPMTSSVPEGTLVARNDGFTASSGNVFRNADIYLMAGASVGNIVTVDADSVGQVTFENNNYYAADGLTTACTAAFAKIAGVNTTYATWTATETTATNLDPQMFGSTGKLKSTSPLIGAGASIPAGVTDALDNPFRVPPTVGAFEYFNGSGPSGSSLPLVPYAQAY